MLAFGRPVNKLVQYIHMLHGIKKRKSKNTTINCLKRMIGWLRKTQRHKRHTLWGAYIVSVYTMFHIYHPVII